MSERFISIFGSLGSTQATYYVDQVITELNTSPEFVDLLSTTVSGAVSSALEGYTTPSGNIDGGSL